MAGDASRGKIGQNIVRAWFDTVVNPLLRVLEAELGLAERRLWTWRFRPRGLEAFRPLRVHLDRAGRDNLEQFEELNTDVAVAIKDHDQSLTLLHESCSKLHEAIVNLPAFRELFARITSDESLGRLATKLDNLFGSYDAEARLQVVAEYIVNGAGELDHYHGIAPLWNAHREELLALKGRDDIRPTVAATETAGSKLATAARNLHDMLKRKRFELSVEHDVPYATPVPPTQTEERFRS